jgi:hypothetical protein
MSYFTTSLIICHLNTLLKYTVIDSLHKEPPVYYRMKDLMITKALVHVSIECMYKLIKYVCTLFFCVDYYDIIQETETVDRCC